jgi:hypothetical protein
MEPVHRLLLLVGAILVAVGASCGSGNRNESRGPIVQDIDNAREAMTSGQADDAVGAVYNLLGRAGEVQQSRKGGDMIRAELPAIVDEYEAEYPAARTRLAELKPRAAGRAFQELELELLDEWHRELPRFASDVARSSNEWGAAIRFGTQSDSMNRRFTASIGEILAILPASEQATVEAAVNAPVNSLPVPASLWVTAAPPRRAARPSVPAANAAARNSSLRSRA